MKNTFYILKIILLILCLPFLILILLLSIIAGRASDHFHAIKQKTDAA